MNKITLALIIAKPGHLRNGLQSLLRTVPQIEMLAESDDLSVLNKMTEEICPELILVDGALINRNNWSSITGIKAEWPGTKIIVLADDDQQGQAARDARADYYLVKGYPATELARLIETSLQIELDDDQSLSGSKEI